MFFARLFFYSFVQCEEKKFMSLNNIHGGQTKKITIMINTMLIQIFIILYYDLCIFVLWILLLKLDIIYLKFVN